MSRNNIESSEGSGMSVELPIKVGGSMKGLIKIKDQKPALSLSKGKKINSR